MRAYDSSRRFFKTKYVRGAYKKATGEGEVRIENSSELGLLSLKILGNTTQAKNDLTSLLKEALLDTANYESAGVSMPIYAIKLPSIFQEKSHKFTLVNTLDIAEAEVLLADDSHYLFATTEALLDSNNEAYSVEGSGFSYIFLSGFSSYEDALNFWQGVEILVDYSYHDYVFSNIGDGGLTLTLASKNRINLKNGVFCGNARVTGKDSEHITVKGNLSYTSANIALPSEGFLYGKKFVLRARCIQNNLKNRGALRLGWFLPSGLFDKSGDNFYARMPAGVYEDELIIRGTISKIPNDLHSSGARLCVAFYSETEVLSASEYTGEEQITYLDPQMYIESEDDGVYESYRDDVALEIPSVAYDENGNEVELRLCGYPQARDYLLLEKNRVKYYKHVGEQRKDLPTEEQQVLSEPIIYDLTENDFAKELLKLNIPYGCDSTIYLSKKTGVEIEYYSVKNEEKIPLTIKYVDENEVEIAPTKRFFVRKESRYKIFAPPISGYTPLLASVEGNMTEETEINLKYKKEE